MQVQGCECSLQRENQRGVCGPQNVPVGRGHALSDAAKASALGCPRELARKCGQRLLGYLAGRTGLNVDELTQALNLDSGLEGLSGVGHDMRTVVAAQV